jgi:hypothetical protein
VGDIVLRPARQVLAKDLEPVGLLAAGAEEEIGGGGIDVGTESPERPLGAETDGEAVVGSVGPGVALEARRAEAGQEVGCGLDGGANRHRLAAQ